MPLLPCLIILFIKISLITIVFFLVSFMLLNYVYHYHGRLSKTIVVGRNGIRGLTYNKSVVEIQWEEIEELIVERRYLISSFLLINLVASDKKREIIFIDKIRNYEELLNIINDRIPHIKKTKRNIWI